MLRAIWAQARTRDGRATIGADGDMPWHLPEDLAYFKRSTSGAPVVMGRRTWESFPPRFRPLPGRRNIVVTRDPAYPADGATLAGSLEEGIRIAHEGAEDVWIIGGAQVYAQAMPHLDELWITEIDAEVDGDAFAPEVGPEWRVVRADPADGWHESASGLRYRFLVCERA